MKCGACITWRCLPNMMNNSGSVQPPDPSLWRFLWLGFVIWVFGTAWMQWGMWHEDYYFKNIDFDPALRVLRVLQFMQTGDWYNDVFPRIDPPAGMVVPWSHPMDFLVAAGGWLFHFFLPWREAMMIWGMLLSPLLWIVLAISLQWAAKPVLHSDAEKITLLIFTGICAGITSTFYLFRGADHHGIVLIFQVLALGALLRSDQSPRWMLIAGILCGFGFWFAIEGFMLFILISTVMGLLWMFGSQKHILAQLKIFLLGMLAVTLPAWLLEQLPDLWIIEHDRISIVHAAWVAFTCMTVFLLDVIPQLKTPAFRWLAGAGAVLLVGGAMQYLFPGFYHGPQQQINPWLQQVWLHQITEIQPMSNAQWWVVMPWYVMAYLGFEYLIKQRPQREGDYGLNAWLLIAVGYLCLTIFSARWGRNLEVMTLPFLAVFIVGGVSWCSRRFLSDTPEWWRPVAQFLIIGTILYAYIELPNIVTDPEYNLETATAQNDCSHGGTLLAQYGDWGKLLGSEPVTVAANEYLTMAVVFWTGHNGVISNYHRNESGFRKIAELIAAPNEAAAHAVMKKYQWGALLLCQPATASESAEKKPYDAINLANVRWLDPRRPPEWLETVPWPKDAEELKSVPLHARPVLLKVRH